MSGHRTDIEAGYDDLIEAAGETIYVTRNDETVELLAIVEKPTRSIEGEDGYLFDTPRQPFVVLQAEYKFENVPVEPEVGDRIEYEGRFYRPQGETATTGHAEPSDPFGKAWRIYTIDEGSAWE